MAYYTHGLRRYKCKDVGPVQAIKIGHRHDGAESAGWFCQARLVFFSLSMSRRMPTATAEDACRPEGYLETRLTRHPPDATPPIRSSPRAFAVGMRRESRRE